MIPVLYGPTESSFTTNGLGRLADCVSCTVTEERNGAYELEMVYPITGLHYGDIEEGNIILAQPFAGGLPQPFVIYKITRPLSGLVTVNAEHISYRLNDIVVMPFHAGSLVQTLLKIKTESATANPFEFTTDISSTVEFDNKAPKQARAILGGSQGSILDVYGGYDYEFNRFDVILHSRRGADNGVTLRYAKNIMELSDAIDLTGVYNGIVPYYMNNDTETAHTLPEVVVMSSVPGNKIKPVDFSSEFTEQAPTEAELRTAAQNYLANNHGWLPNQNITVSFVALFDTEEYKYIAPLERVSMGDTVRVVYDRLGVDTTTRVIKTEYNVLLDRYNEITLGDTAYSLTTALNNAVNSATEQANAATREAVANATSHMQGAIAHATELIQGGLGGHVYTTINADGEPEEILVMDTDSIETATNVIRINQNGIGFSTTGYDGTYTTAWTIDGHFVADFIDTGNLNASLIKTGVLTDHEGNIEWNLSTGEMTANALTIDSPYFDLDDTGKITSTGSDGKKITIDKAVITGYKADGTLSASLEVGDGLFNIANGALAIQGYVGVTGSIQGVASITPIQETFIDSVSITTPQSLFLTGATLSGGGCTYNQGYFSTNTIQYMTPYGTQASATFVTGWSLQPGVTYTSPTLTTQTANALTGAIPSTTTRAVSMLGPSSVQTRWQYFKYGLLTQSST